MYKVNKQCFIGDRLSVKEHHRDQDVCGVCLDVLIQLVPHLVSSEGSSSVLKESRETVLHIVNAFWYGVVVVAAIASIDHFTLSIWHSFLDC